MSNQLTADFNELDVMLQMGEDLDLTAIAESMLEQLRLVPLEHQHQIPGILAEYNSFAEKWGQQHIEKTTCNDCGYSDYGIIQHITVDKQPSITCKGRRTTVEPQLMVWACGECSKPKLMGVRFQIDPDWDGEGIRFLEPFKHKRKGRK